MGNSEDFNILSSPEEFEKIFREKYRSLCYLAFKYVKNTDAAEEIVQDVFVKIWEKKDQIILKSSAISYLVTSVKNHSLNYLKHSNIVKIHKKSEISKATYDSSDTETEMQDMELESAILNAIAELPSQRRKIFTLSRVDGLKYHEIAEKMGLSIKTIEAQMGKALKQLKLKLKDYIAIMFLILVNYF
jgi:RNA polymerase sigma-70 factor (ECF subfamily)